MYHESSGSVLWVKCTMIRRIVSSTASVYYSLSKYLATLLRHLLGPISQSCVSISEDCIGKIRNINLEGKIMVSFDVDSLFTNVPVNVPLEFLQNHLSVNHLDLPFSNHVLFQPINLCTMIPVEMCYDSKEVYFDSIVFAEIVSFRLCMMPCTDFNLAEDKRRKTKSSHSLWRDKTVRRQTERRKTKGEVESHGRHKHLCWKATHLDQIGFNKEIRSCSEFILSQYMEIIYDYTSKRHIYL